MLLKFIPSRLDKASIFLHVNDRAREIYKDLSTIGILRVIDLKEDLQVTHCGGPLLIQ